MNNKHLTEARRISGDAGADWAKTVPMTYKDACAVLRDTDKTGRFEWHDNPEDVVMDIDTLDGAVIALARVVLAEEALSLGDATDQPST